MKFALVMFGAMIVASANALSSLPRLRGGRGYGDKLGANDPVDDVLAKALATVAANLHTLVPISLAVYLLGASLKVVGQNDELIIQRLGKFQRKLGAGLHFTIPLIETVAFGTTLREQCLDVPPQECITKDNAPLTADAVVFFRVVDACKAFYMVSDFSDALTNLVLTQIRAEIGKLSLDDTFSARQELNRLIMAGLDDVAQGWGLQVTRIELKDITPSRDILAAMELQMAAERRKRATVLESEGQQQARVNIAQGDKESSILLAEGNRDAAVVKAEGEFARIKREAEAMQTTLEVLAQSFSAGDKDIDKAEAAARSSELFLARQFLLAQFSLASSPNAKVVCLPGSIVDIVQAAKQMVPKAA